MKKRLFLVFLLLLLAPITVKAENEDNEDNKHYMYYYVEEFSSSEFYEKGKNDPEYPFLGSLWYYDSNFKYSYDAPDEEETRVIRTIPIIKYQEYQKVRYIMIDKIVSSGRINLQEIEVFVKDTQIKYRSYCDNCSSTFFDKIQNANQSGEYNYIDNGTEIILDLEKEYFPDDITIKIHTYGPSGKTANFRVTINNTREFSDAYYQYEVNTTLGPYNLFQKKLKDVKHEERLEKEIKEISGVESVENAKTIERKDQYQYQVKLHQYYQERRHYLESYYKEYPGFLGDEDNNPLTHPYFIKDEERFIIPEVIEPPEPEVIIKTEYVDKVEYVDKTEYIDNPIEVPVIQEEIKEVPKTITEYIEKKVPIVTEKIKYVDNFIEVPKEVIKEQKIEVKPKKNYLKTYLIYFFVGIILKKTSFFRG